MGKASIWTQTRREKTGTIDGINLFFGALLGANLGTTGTMPLQDYAFLIGLLAGLVMTIRLVSTSERRVYALALLGIYLAAFAAMLFVPGLGPEGMSNSDINRIAVTILIWVATTMITEYYPTREVEDQAEA